jgi:NAD kinase
MQKQTQRKTRYEMDLVSYQNRNRSSMKIISAVEAKRRKLSRYYTGVPCVHGHLTERVTRNRRCLECTRIDDRKKKSSLKYKMNEKNILRQRKRDMKKFDIKTFGEESAKYIPGVPQLREKLYKTLDVRTGQFICSYFNQPMTFIPNDKMVISFDRLDNSKPHTIDNIQCISWKANDIKQDRDPYDLIIVAQKEINRRKNINEQSR